jgi:hypothetical protein
LKRVHLLQIEDAPSRFEPLVRAVSKAGMRVGWLDFRSIETPDALAAASATGVFRAVSVGESSTVSVKSRIGPAVTKDLIREYFQGCSVVLISGRETAVSLHRRDDQWAVSSPGGEEEVFTTERLVAALRRVRPFGV